jgi:8-oxo-dGTP pyrophosphatase MutT (NUDIX family)
MKIFTRKNALVGYLVLNTRKRAVEKRLRRRRRSGLKVATYVGLGLVSAGILAAALAIAARRRAHEAAGMDAGAEDELEIVGEYVTAPAEPIPAT